MYSLSKFMGNQAIDHSSDIQIDLELEKIHKHGLFRRVASIFLMVLPILLIINIYSNWIHASPLSNLEIITILSLLFIGTSISLYFNEAGFYNLAVWVFLAVCVIGLMLKSVCATSSGITLFYFSAILMIAKPLLNKRGLFALTVTMVAIIGFTAWIGADNKPISKESLMLFIVSCYIILLLISIFRDDLEKERQNLLERNDQRLNWIIHQIPAIIWIVEDNIDAKVLPSAYYNKLVQFNFNHFIQSQTILEKIEAIKLSNKQINFEYMHNNYTYYTQLEPLHDKDNRVIGCIGMTTDITTQKQQSEYELGLVLDRKRIEILEEFLASASHDLRTPLSSLNLSIYLLSQSNLDEKQSEYLSRLEESTERFAYTIEQMFMVMKLNLDSASESKEYNLASIVRSSVQSFEGDITNPLIKIETFFEASKARVRGDEEHMEKAITNILQNAFDSIDEVGTISVSTHNIENHILITIKDTGRGIHKDDLPYITQAFYRIDKHRPGNHVGLGLTVSKNVIEKHEGTLTIKSTLGVGTHIEVSIPIDKDPKASQKS